MSIVVQHSDPNAQSYSAIIEYLAAQQEARRRQQEQAAREQQDMLGQLAPLLAARMRGGQPTNGYAPEEPPTALPAAPQSIQSQAVPPPMVSGNGGYGGVQQQPVTYRTPRAGGRVNLDSLFGGSIGDNGTSKGALAQYNAQQIAQRGMADDQRQMEMAGLQGNIALFNKLMGDELPVQIQESLGKTVRYGKEQEQEQRSILNGLAKIDSDRTLSPQEKWSAKMPLAYRFNEIKNNPQPMLAQDRPVTPQQQFEENKVVHVDPDTGKKTYGFLGTRGGSPNFVPLKPQADPAESHRYKMEEIAAQNAAKETPRDKSIAASQKSRQDSRRSAVYSKVATAESDARKAEDEINAARVEMRGLERDDETYVEAEKALGRAVLSMERADARLIEARDERDKFDAEVDAMAMPLADPEIPVGEPALPPPAAPPMPAAPPEDLGAPLSEGQPGSAAPAVSPDPAVGQQQWSSLPIGAETTLPNGQRVVKDGPTSYHPVQ